MINKKIVCNTEISEELYQAILDNENWYLDEYDNEIVDLEMEDNESVGIQQSCAKHY